MHVCVKERKGECKIYIFEKYIIKFGMSLLNMVKSLIFARTKCKGVLSY